MRILKNESDKWIISVGKHKGIIHGKTFVLIQDILCNNADKNIKMQKLLVDYLSKKMVR